MMRTVLYARYSSDLQNPKSTEDQLNDLRSRCEREGWEIVGEFSDDATSGAAGLSEAARPGINALLTRLDKGDVDQVLVEATDRLARHTGDALHIYEQVTYANARIFTLSDGPISELIAVVKGFFDADYRRGMGSKVVRGQKGAVRDGRSPGGIAYGYRKEIKINADGEPILGLREIVPDRADIVRRIFTEYADGMSPIMIARRLNEEGIPGPRGPWLAGTILGDRKRRNGILQNRIYIGQLVYNRSTKVLNPKTRKYLIKPRPESEWEIVEVQHLRIVPQDLWEAVQAKRDEGAGRSFSRDQYPKRLLSGIAVCGCCGSNWIVTGKERWSCSSNRFQKGCKNSATITTGQFEARVLHGLQRRMLDPQLIDIFVREFHKERARILNTQNQKQKTLEANLTSATREIERLVEAIAQGGAEFPEIEKALKNSKNKRAKIERELAEISAVSVVTLHPRIAETYREEVSKLAEALTSDEETKLKAHKVIRSLIGQLVVTPRKAGRGVDIEVSGRLASILALASGEELPAAMYAVDGAGERILTETYKFARISV